MLFFLLACKTLKTAPTVTPAPELIPVTVAPPVYGPAIIKQRITESPVLQQSFVGFALYDPQLNQMVVEHNTSKYFVPASNTKLFTLYASLKMLPDTLPALKYAVRGDSLLFWGTGDPTFTHMDLKNSLAYDFLKNRREKLYYLEAPFTSTPFAVNWGWDDYSYYYQPERNVFPVHGNIVKFTRKTLGAYATTPRFFKKNIKTNTALLPQRDAFKRAWRTNDFTFYPKHANPGFSVEVPFITSPELTVKLLADTLKRPVKWVKRAIPATYKILPGLPIDTVLKRMMQVSDNLLAEQLMVLGSGTLSDTLSVERAIKHALKTYLTDLPDTPVWVDGSGLSSMNMFTPRSVIYVLQKLLQERSPEKLLPLLAVGGRPGTFRNIYKAEVPFVFGKSGSLSHVYNQSGYLLTKSGKILLFSFMNNNYRVPTANLRNEMEKIVTEIHEKY
ncbi:D-alanyl-D-alanine carboxypeptidase [Adhaeribacter rhizoryzae]|uniref:Peptidase S13 n=1 Tax=Adhaeribacter rhizoryzae TaxID=2607907 RepID=A0A5M6DAZ7_9BACT|nr:D-alanyl-D-alanine carboxypeptidase [Adhaeribacter rhizoryzae]KAA5543482.1 peptidase S13 [Adhaeribacter rhizoryzae]